MQKLLRLNHRKKDQGFTTLEILISIIIALAFVSVTMQSFVLAMAMKVQAQEKQRANQLIQEDLELISELSTIIPAEELSLTPPHTFAQKCNAIPAGGGAVDYDEGFAQDLWNELQNEKPDGDASLSVKLLKKADGTEVGNSLTLTRTNVSAGDPTATPAIAVSSVAPHRTLKINYQVADNDNNVIAERYVEVIPDVALRCP